MAATLWPPGMLYSALWATNSKRLLVARRPTLALAPNLPFLSSRPQRRDLRVLSSPANTVPVILSEVERSPCSRLSPHFRMAALGLPADFLFYQKRGSEKPRPELQLLVSPCQFYNQQNNSFRGDCPRQSPLHSNKFCRLSEVVEPDNV